MLVFIDDSGDPGFKIDKGSSLYFVITLVIFDDILMAENVSVAIKNLKRNLKVSDMYEFRFNKTNQKFKSKFFEAVRSFKFRTRAIVVGKNNIRSSYLIRNKENFYNFIIMQVLKQSKGYIKNAKLKFDRRGERALRDELRTYLSRELDNKRNKFFTDLRFVDSRQNTLIQLADMVAGSIFSAYSKKQKKYLKVLQESKRIEDIWEFK